MLTFKTAFFFLDTIFPMFCTVTLDLETFPSDSLKQTKKDQNQTKRMTSNTSESTLDLLTCSTEYGDAFMGIC